MLYTDQLKTKEWAKKRLSIFKRDGFKCVECGSKKNIQAHHRRYIRGKMAWEVPDKLLETLCRKCHEGVHNIKPISTFFSKGTKGQPNLSKSRKKIPKLMKGMSKRDKTLQSRYDKLKK